MRNKNNNDPFRNPLLSGSLNASDKDPYSVENRNLALLSVKNRANSDPRHNSKFNSTAALPNLSHTHFATGLVPVLGDEIAHGMQRSHAPSILGRSQGSLVLAIFLLCSISLGVGVFILPGIFLLIGIGPGVVMLIFYAILALYTQLLVLDCAAMSNVKSYEQLASTTLGRFGEFLLALFMAVSLLTGNCGHISTVGQVLHDVIDFFYTNQYEDYDFDSKKMAILYIVMLSLTIPWLFQRTLRGLSGVGTLAVMTVVLTVVSLIVICIIELANGNGASEANHNAPVYGFSKVTTKEFWITDFWRACPTIAFVYTPLLELFPVYTELNNQNVAQTRISVYIATFICCLMYTAVSVVVIVTYGTDTMTNSLYNVPAENYWFTFCCFLLVIVITLLYPVINYPMINALETILDLFGCCTVKGHDVNDDVMDDAFCDVVNTSSIQGGGYREIENDRIDIMDISLLSALFKPSIWWEYTVYHRRDVLSVLFIFVVIGVDIGVTDLDDLFGLCGSLGLSFVCYIFPCMIWISSKWKRKQLSFISPSFIFAIFVLLFSTTVMVYSTAVIIKNII